MVIIPGLRGPRVTSPAMWTEDCGLDNRPFYITKGSIFPARFAHWL